MVHDINRYWRILHPHAIASCVESACHFKTNYLKATKYFTPIHHYMAWQIMQLAYQGWYLQRMVAWPIMFLTLYVKPVACVYERQLEMLRYKRYNQG